MRKVNRFSGRLFCIVAVIKSYAGLFLGFSKFIIDLISFLENLFNGLFASTLSVRT